MSLHLTPEILHQSYELLRYTPPFNRWKLPHADNVEFFVVGRRDQFADCEFLKLPMANRWRIRISGFRVRTLAVLIPVMAHEMCHMRDPSRSHHGRNFHRLADQVCRKHDFDRGTF